jgi:hypothetical protein
LPTASELGGDWTVVAIDVGLTANRGIINLRDAAT